MSVLVLTEHAQSAFKKKSLEAVQYAAHIAKELGTTVTAVAAGNVSNEEMQTLGAYGAQKVLHVDDARLNNFDSRAYAKAMLAAAHHGQGSCAKVVCSPEGRHGSRRRWLSRPVERVYSKEERIFRKGFCFRQRYQRCKGDHSDAEHICSNEGRRIGNGRRPGGNL